MPPDEVPLDFLHPSDQPGCLGTLGPYQVIDVIGRGGMGIVLRALDPKLNRIVAVKVLAPELAANPNARRRFLREAQAAAAVSHPHVVTIHAVDEDKLPYLVMECVVGQSLQEKLDRDGALATDRNPPHRPASRRGAGRRAPTRADPPRHQAGQHPAGERRRAGQDHGLRPGARRR